MMSIQDGLNKILSEWPVERQKQFAQNSLASFIRNEFPNEVEKIAHEIDQELILKGSPGQGNWADVPWLAILNPKITNSTENGIYPVYLFRADASGVYLTLGQGISEPKRLYGKREADQLLLQRAKQVRYKVEGLANWQEGPTELRSKTGLGQGFEKPNIGARFYKSGEIPSEETLVSDLRELLVIYEKVANLWPSIKNLTPRLTQAPTFKCSEFCELLQKMRRDRGKLYKPAMMACVLEGIDSKELTQNKIKFDWISPLFIKKMATLGKTVKNTQACMPFVHLRGDSFWELSYHDEANPIRDGAEGVQAIHNKIRYAQLKAEYWDILQNEQCRKECLSVIRSMLEDGENPMPLSMKAFSDAASSAGLKQNASIALNTLSALDAKPFLLLTGLSGSGKTQLASAFSKWICASNEQYELIAVGADWTSNENLLGYPDALNPGHYRKPDNGALDLILRAKADQETPYFLILDEMNLSHVERYFADFLSAMESGEPISLHDGDEDSLWDDIPGKLRIPENLFVIGTVNVDETTYMFSPKVLDRANVIEFRVTEKEMSEFLSKPVKPNLDDIAGNGKQYAKAFVSAAKEKEFELDEQENVSKVLMKFFPALQEAGAEFGYRTAHEICRFVYFHKSLSDENWNLDDAMDAAIMQKLLPKLHGSKKKLGPVLEKLVGLFPAELYPTSVAKIARMQQRLAEHGFTSFAEA